MAWSKGGAGQGDGDGSSRGPPDGPGSPPTRRGRWGCPGPAAASCGPPGRPGWHLTPEVLMITVAGTVNQFGGIPPGWPKSRRSSQPINQEDAALRDGT